MMFSSAANRGLARRIDDQPGARESLAHEVVRVAFESHRDASRHERAEALSGRSGELQANRVVGKPLRAVTSRDLEAKPRADRPVHVPNREVQFDRLLPLQRVARPRDDLIVERLVEPVILRTDPPPDCGLRDVGRVQHLREIDARGLPVRQGVAHLETIDTADHLVDGAEPELRHQLAHFFGDEPEVVLDELRLAGELLAQLRILRGDADRAGVQVADAHHHAARHDERRRREPELLGAKQRRDHDVSAGLELPVDLHRDAIAQVVQHQDLLRLGEARAPTGCRCA